MAVVQGPPDPRMKKSWGTNDGVKRHLRGRGRCRGRGRGSGLGWGEASNDVDLARIGAGAIKDINPHIDTALLYRGEDAATE